MNNRKSKGQTLKYLQSRVSKFRIPSLLVFTAGEFIDFPDKVISEIQKAFPSLALAIRSSSANEDGEKNAAAGEYDSVLNVSSSDANEINNAISKVILSYKKKIFSRDHDEIIIQEMVLNTSMSGVVFTHELNSGAPYYVINYDDISGLTDSVTSGSEYANRTLYVHRSTSSTFRSERFQGLITAVKELEELTQNQFLDIEFAIGYDGMPYLLQVRSITTRPNWNRGISHQIDLALNGVQEFIEGRLGEMPGVYGLTTVLGQMPDWNPAEMIGRTPRALAFSLYKTLITDSSWSMARKAMGYDAPLGQPLMLSLAGQPYIDARLSFHSFLPNDLDHEIKKKLVNVWVERLRTHPELHDKVEFDIAITAFSFDCDSKIESQVGGALTDSEKKKFREVLRSHTNKLIVQKGLGGIDDSLNSLKKLSQKQNLHQLHSYNNLNLSILHGIIDDCIHLGTIPFAILARHAFIAKNILLSFVSAGIISNEEVQLMQAGFKTVASELVEDVRLLQSGIKTNEEFMGVYGHLRPGTYDILSSRYDQMENFGFRVDAHLDCDRSQSGTEPFIYSLSDYQINRINQLLSEDNFDEINAYSLIEYIERATVAREFGKFIFTRTVSDLLEFIARYGEAKGLSRDEMSHIPISEILNIAMSSTSGSIEERLREISKKESEKYLVTSAIRLPQVLFDIAGVHIVPFQVSLPNFITQKRVTGECIYLDASMSYRDLADKIVVIENADPGFDWIFSQDIAGLITKYGGSNSHMAIRCAEFGIPAAIGCGEQRFEVIVKSVQLHLDCLNGLIKSLN